MPMYQKLISDPTQYQHFGYFNGNAANPPFAASSGFEWVDGNLPGNSVPYQQPNLLNQLDTLYQTLDGSDQIQFLPYVGGIYALISQGQIAQAKGLLAVIPTTGQAATVQTAMLALFP